MGKTKTPRVVLCDLDGVVWLAHTPIAGSVEAIAAMRTAGIRVLFVTNNSFSTYQQQVAALEKIGVPADGDVVTSAMSAVTALQPGWRVLVCGGEGLIDEVTNAGCDVVVPYQQDSDGSFDAVVVGFHREFTFHVLTQALTAVRGGARLIGSNSDPQYPTPTGPIPGGGAILAAIEKASETKATVTGKPHLPMAQLVKDMCPGIEVSDMVMVGDRADTDGGFAATLGCRFALVMSGTTAVSDGIAADIVAPDLAAVVRQLLPNN